MSISPQSAHAIVLYGQKACEQFESMVRYFQKALSVNAWNRLCFICASPTPFSPPAEDLPRGLLYRQAFVTPDNRITLDQATVEAVHAMCAGGSVYFHFVCDDFDACAFDISSIPQLISALKGYFEDQRQLNLYAFLFMHLLDNNNARIAQRTFAKDIVERFHGSRVYPYLIANLLSDGSPCEDWHIWRAIMCEILAIMAQRQMHLDGAAYSLGYMSLNANDEELYALRWKELCALFSQRCDLPITENDAWAMLTGSNLQPGISLHEEYQVRSLVESWIGAFVSENTIQPSKAILHNFRRLAGVEQQSLASIERAAQKFFELNFSYTQDPEAVASNLIDRFLLQLSRCPNAARFPASLLEKLEYILNMLLEQDDSPSSPSIPAKKPLQPMKNYLLQCSELYEAHYRQRTTRNVIQAHARALLNELPRVREFVQNAQQTQSVVSDLQKAGTLQLPDARKYPHYASAIAKTLLTLQSTIFPTEKLFSPDGMPLSDAIHRLLSAADDTLHHRMGPGFNGSFIDAIRAEFDSSEQMKHFLGNYVAGNLRMFNNLYEPSSECDSLYFTDVNLGDTSWAQQNAHAYLLVDNDNVELLNRFTLKNGLEFFVGSSIPSQSNLYFSDASTDALFPFVSSTPFPADNARSSDASAFEVAPHHPASTAPQDANPHHIRLISQNNVYLLVWDWEAGLSSVAVELNGKTPVIISVNDYNYYGGYNVSGLLSFGRNDVRIKRLSDGALYGACTFLGRQTQVRYNLSGNTLVVENIGAELSQMILRETIGKQHIDYPLLPISSDHQPGRVVYSNLKLQGTAELLCDPSEAYPPYRAVIDWGL